jgi:GH18 family chitinase
MCTHISVGGLLKVNTKSGIVTPITELMQRKTQQSAQTFESAVFKINFELLNAVWSDASQMAETMGVKLLVSLGGWNGLGMLSDDFAQISASDTLRSVFVTQLATFVNTHDFNGVIVSWQYPGCRGVYFQYLFKCKNGNNQPSHFSDVLHLGLRIGKTKLRQTNAGSERRIGRQGKVDYGFVASFCRLSRW